ncbi:MAG: hypothetical protein H6828_13525 [Planctomycetes bacterium]|nr:hypothetical protein [Planctomycetota bacterium]
MVLERRFGPLMVCVVLGLGVLLLRLWQVQVVEHDVWAAEALNLTRNATIDPYLRGPIGDRNGEAFVRDVPAASIRFVYREFRREHPLGQVAHARSALEQRSVPLQEALEHLAPWTFALLDSTPLELEAFERGEAVVLAGVAHPAVGRGEARRRARANDLRFYVRGLLDLELRDWRAIKRKLKQEQNKSCTWLELAVMQATRKDYPLATVVEQEREAIAKRLDTSRGRLAQLAGELGVGGPEGELAVTSDQSLAWLVDALELKRRAVEDAILGDLFRTATGFEPGRLEADELLAYFDVDELVETLGWDRARVEQWARETRAAWLENFRTYHVPAALIRAELARREGALPLEAIVGELAGLFAPRPRTAAERRALARHPLTWRERDDLAVFAELDDLFEDLELDRGAVGVLPCTDELVRAAPLELDAVPPALVPFEEAAHVAATHPPAARTDWRGEPLPPWSAPASPGEAVARLERLLRWRAGETNVLGEVTRPEPLDDEELLPWLAELWQARFQRQLAARLAAARDEAGAPVAWPRPLASHRRKEARKVGDYAVRDRSSRPETLHDSPDEAVMGLLLRFRADYGGFSILPRTKRLFLAQDEDEVPVASDLIGIVRESTLEEVIDQRNQRSALSRIARQTDLSDDDRAEIDALVEQIYRSDEVHGTSGVEALCDEALRGVNGFHVSVGLQEREDAGRAQVDKEKVDGLEVRLTLDLALQKAAQYTIEHPVLPSGETTRDDVWFKNPVGAIVLATVDGEILAAASGPKEPNDPVLYRDEERRYTYDRCFHRRQFMPVGSIFKPFAAAYALDHLGLTPETVFRCDVRPDFGTAGWGKVACHSRGGHGALTLEHALEESCNAYFAQVGELYESKERFVEMARLFGFDEPSGVTNVGAGAGFAESVHVRAFGDRVRWALTQLHRGANGLEVVEATPVQVARAAAGLATGRLPEMRLVASIGGVPTEPRWREVPLSEYSLDLVRHAMRGVVAQGSAQGKGLESSLLGFDLAGKTGSADYLPMSNGYRAQLRSGTGSTPAMRKHTWFMGFFPAEAPRAVVVVYLHDIGVTSSHSAVYVAGQFLKSPAVQAWAREGFR